MVDRVLELAGGGDSEAAESNLRAFRVILMMAICCEAWMDAVNLDPSYAEFTAVMRIVAPLLTVGLVAALARRWERWVTGGALVVLLYPYFLRFPGTANHHGLILVCLALLTFFDLRREDERWPLLIGLRWVVVIVFFYTGFQKLLYGLYFQGEYFAYFIATNTRFVDFFRFILPAEELARIQALGAAAPGAGPYRIEWLPFVVVSNATVWGEMILPLLLLFRRTRALALAGSLVLIAAIELGAREFIFGSLFAGLALLFAKRTPLKILAWVFAGMYVVMIVLKIVAPGLPFA